MYLLLPHLILAMNDAYMDLAFEMHTYFAQFFRSLHLKNERFICNATWTVELATFGAIPCDHITLSIKKT